jgi:hypothetical protein
MLHFKEYYLRIVVDTLGVNLYSAASFFRVAPAIVGEPLLKHDWSLVSAESANQNSFKGF